MKLSKEDAALFHAVYSPLLAYANRELHLHDGLEEPEDVPGTPLEALVELRDALFDRPRLLKAYADENPHGVPEAHREIVRGWQHHVRGTFHIMRCLRDHTVFLKWEEDSRAYGVLGLNTTFEEMFGPHLPVMVDAVLLPFQGVITYDGLLQTYSITFGPGMRGELEDACGRAEFDPGLITSLPFTTGKARRNDADRLRFYLRNRRNRERYWEEIGALIEKDEALRILYHQEIGKVHARTARRRLRQAGLSRGWYALLDDTVVASGESRAEVEAVLDRLLQEDRRRHAYVFQLKGK
jgi:hypothetical protein